jgi:predicted ATPase
MLKRLKLTNWRSLRDVSIDFAPLTVFIGANASGKTNIIEALGVLRDRAVTNSLDELAYVWSFKDSISHGAPDQKIVMDWWYADHDSEGDDHDSLSWKLGLPSSDDRILEDRLMMTCLEDAQILAEGFKPSLTRPIKMRRYALQGIDEDGENTLYLLDYLWGRNPALKEAFMADYRYIVPHLEAMDIDKTDTELRLVARERHYAGSIISAGTARVAAMLAALYWAEHTAPLQKSLFENLEARDIVVIEEPDAALNPRALSRLVDVLRRFVEDDKPPRQIILTTHNPTFLNYFKPEEVRVVERDEADGSTQVYPIPADILDGQTTLHALGDLWQTGALGGLR